MPASLDIAGVQPGTLPAPGVVGLIRRWDIAPGVVGDRIEPPVRSGSGGGKRDSKNGVSAKVRIAEIAFRRDLGESGFLLAAGGVAFQKVTEHGAAVPRSPVSVDLRVE